VNGSEHVGRLPSLPRRDKCTARHGPDILISDSITVENPVNSHFRMRDNIVGIEIGVLRGQCLDRPIGEREVLTAEIEAWQRQHNAFGDWIRLKFNTQKARDKLTRAYPDTTKESKSL